jgi:hypothetical protein
MAAVYVLIHQNEAALADLICSSGEQSAAAVLVVTSTLETLRTSTY